MRTHRKPVDWDAEIEKTERIQRRGFIMSAVSFAVAAAFIFGINKFGGSEVDIPGKVLSVACLIAACLVFRAVLRHRANVKRERAERNAADGGDVK